MKTIKKASFWMMVAALAGGSLCQLGCIGWNYWSNPYARAVVLWLTEDLFS